MNRQTKHFRKLGLSVKFNKGVDFSHMGTHRKPDELSFVQRPCVRGRCVNSSAERKAHGKKSR